MQISLLSQTKVIHRFPPAHFKGGLILAWNESMLANLRYLIFINSRINYLRIRKY